MECEFDPNYVEEIENIMSYKNEEINKMKTNLEETVNSLKKRKEALEEKINQTKWHNDYMSLKESYESEMERLKAKGLDLEEVNNLLRLKEIKEKELEELTKMEKLLETEYETLEQIKVNYIDIRQKISLRRQQFANKMLEDTNIKLKINRFRDYDDFIYKFRGIIQKTSGFAEEIDSIAETCFAGEIKSNIKSLNQKISDVKYKGENLFGGKFNKVINTLNDEQVAELQLFLPEDDIQIEYTTDGKSYKSLKNASAGQRTSAILTFILADGDAPLVLDQPEDDLDNHLIYDLVVERIKYCKQKRQIIVITHNANIPVNGDAELIIAMNSSSRDLSVFKSGTIEDKELRDEICSVMEGGEKAFTMRASRYAL